MMGREHFKALQRNHCHSQSTEYIGQGGTRAASPLAIAPQALEVSSNSGHSLSKMLHRSSGKGSKQLFKLPRTNTDNRRSSQSPEQKREKPHHIKQHPYNLGQKLHRDIMATH